METYKINIEYNNEHKGYHPVTVTVYAVSIDPKGYEIFESSGKSLRACLNKAAKAIYAHETDLV